MKKNMFRRIAATVLTIVLMAAMQLTAFASSGIEEGHFSDFDIMTWTTWDGVSTTYGRGPKFSDVHPEITDPEYYLKEAVLYPGEDINTRNSQGKIKSDYPDEVVEELRKFVNSFDWIHSDELTRATKVYGRIANGQHGNIYEYPEQIDGFPLLVGGKGQCRNFSGEFQRLANYIGLECETYEPFYLHESCLVKISGQWFATDPTGGDAELPFLSNALTHPVDYETEKNRYAKESDAKWDAYFEENPDSWAAQIYEKDRQLASGEITREQYDEWYDRMDSEIYATK